jgi:outer membrane immunogenic protein
MIMRLTALSILTGIGLSLAANGAGVAADLMVEPPLYKAEPPLAPNTPWTGCYGGANFGYGWASNQWSAAGVEFASHTGNGLIGGIELGCDYQTGPWVMGIQGLFDGSDFEGSSHRIIGALEPDLNDQSRVQWLATVTGRIGYVVLPNMLAYMRAGMAWTHDQYVECCLSTSEPSENGRANETRTGWTVGIGLDYLVRPDWSLFVEYDFVGLGTRSLTFSPIGLATGGPFAYDIRQNVQTVLFGAAYRFTVVLPARY